MSFGRNPHVAKAQGAEEKAAAAGDAMSRERAWREAAHLWERAAGHEKEGKRKTQYLDNAERARSSADTPGDGEAPMAAVIKLQAVHPSSRRG